jgi:hypothetical protein
VRKTYASAIELVRRIEKGRTRSGLFVFQIFLQDQYAGFQNT